MSRAQIISQTRRHMGGREQYLKIRDRKSGEEICLEGAVTFGRGISQSVCVTDFTLSSFLLTSSQRLLTKPKRKLVGKGSPYSPQNIVLPERTADSKERKRYLSGK